MLWITLLATASLALGEVDIITSPTPGNEYVKITGSPQDAANLTEPKVQIKDEGLSGLQHKPYPIKKAEHISLKKDALSIKATVKDEGLSGVVKKTSGIGVPPLKHIDDPKFEVLSRKNKRDDGGLDFDDDDLPLSDKKLKPSGTSQSSRINVKKGPNGQEYEYEYVYYYYDDDDDSTGSPTTAAPAPQSRGQHSDDRAPSRKPVSEPSEEPRVRGELIKQKNVESGPDPPRFRGESEHRGGHRVVEVTEPLEEEPLRRRADPRTEDRSKNRYTTIERGSPSGGRGREPVAVTTAEPQLNEVLPSRGNQRSRGRHVEAAIIEDDRLPANTRFPSRGRGSSVATTLPPQPSQPAQSQPSRTRGQGNGATIRRPSLVDSSSFRTHSSDAAPDADLDQNYYRASPVQDTRESDLEEYVQPELVRPTTFVPAQTTTPPTPAPLPEQPEDDMPDKAAHDLYAILQQQQEENSVSGIGGSEVDTFSPTEVVTTAEPTTVTTTTTTTTTTEAPTTTTTTTTTTPPPPPPPPATGRGRFRGAPGSRTRSRAGAVSTTTTTEAAPQEEEAPRRKFSPSHGGRTPGQVSAYGRRGAAARASTTTAAPVQEEVSTARSRASFGGNSGNRYRARKPTATTSAPQEDEATPETTSAATTHSRPTRPRLNVSAATRPLRPGPRINLRGRGGISTPAPTPAPAPVEEEPSPAPVTSPPPAAPVEEEEVSPSPAAPTDALSRLRNRPRLKVIPRQPGAPSASSPRPLPQGFRRPGRPLSQQATPAPEEAAPALTEPEPVQTEAPAQVAEPAPTEPPPPPHLARRRPAIRRLQIPHHQ